MTSINFTGLASGLDTDMIVKSLMEIERQPLTRLEENKKFQQSRLEAFKMYNDKLSALNTAVGALYLSSGLRENRVSISNEDCITANASGAQSGTYQVTVERLAQVQKNASENAYASRTDKFFGTGNLTLTVGGTSHTISITEENNSLMGIINVINNGISTHGISASIIDNGNEYGDRFYLVLTGADSSVEFTMESDLAGGNKNLSMQEPSQIAQKAVAYIDGIQITSKINTIENSISGLTLTLESVSPEDGLGQLTPTILKISLNKDSVAEKIENFVKAYNDILAFISGQPTEEEPGAGMLVKDSMVEVAKRRLQNMLVTKVNGTDAFTSLVQLGLSTNKDGTISLDNSKLAKVMEENFDDVANLLAGDDGIFKQYRSYLNNLLSSSAGLYAARQQSIKSITDRIDNDILRVEHRLEKREQMLIKRFSAMESLVSALNAQSEYLTQQMDLLSNMGGKKK
jgi:flagellar hook-associated protein 2